MAVIEKSLGLTPDLSGMLGNRKVLIVEGGTDALIINKLSGLLRKEGDEGLSDSIYIWPAQTATKTPMYAAFAIGQKWDAAVLLDSDVAGNTAKEKIEELYVKKIAEENGNKFRILMLGKGASLSKTDAAIEDLFPDEFYLDCVNEAFGLAIKQEDLPQDGSDMIATMVETVLKTRYSIGLDKKRVLGVMLKKFDSWKTVDDLPGNTYENAKTLLQKINNTLAADLT
jgi:predicted ATP-dependent endonuclease of OLD family